MRDDEGSTLLLTIFYGFLSLVLVLLVVAASSLYLERKRLFTLADGAALVGAEAFDLTAVSLTPSGPRPILESPDVAAAVTSIGMPSGTSRETTGGVQWALRVTVALRPSTVSARSMRSDWKSLGVVAM